LRCWPKALLRSALDKVTPIKLAGKFWRVVATSSLLGLVRGENGLPEVTRVHPNLLFAGDPRRVGGCYTPIKGPDTLYLASSERAANAEWKAGLQALFPGVEHPPKTVFATKVNLTRVLDLSTRRDFKERCAPTQPNWLSRGKLATDQSRKGSALLVLNQAVSPPCAIAALKLRRVTA
jgi:hypothetical protein